MLYVQESSSLAAVDNFVEGVGFSGGGVGGNGVEGDVFGGEVNV